MNGRTPTKKEKLYIQAVLTHVGCIACIIDGREIDNPELWTELHHDPDYGSVDEHIAVRHPPLSNCARFVERYGTDEFLCAQTWELLPQSVKDEIGFDLSLGEVPGDTK